jgi:hypothetical protein
MYVFQLDNPVEHNKASEVLLPQLSICHYKYAIRTVLKQSDLSRFTDKMSDNCVFDLL